MSAEIEVAAIWEAVARIRKANGDADGVARAKVNKTARASATKYRAKFARCGSSSAVSDNPSHYRASVQKVAMAA